MVPSKTLWIWLSLQELFTHKLQENRLKGRNRYTIWPFFMIMILFCQLYLLVTWSNGTMRLFSLSHVLSAFYSYWFISSIFLFIPLSIEQKTELQHAANNKRIVTFKMSFLFSKHNHSLKEHVIQNIRVLLNIWLFQLTSWLIFSF